MPGEDDRAPGFCGREKGARRPAGQQVRLSRHPWDMASSFPPFVGPVGASTPPSGLWDPTSSAARLAPFEMWVQFAGTLALQQEPWGLYRWAGAG